MKSHEADHEEDMTQISPRSNNHNNFLVFFSGKAFKLGKVGPAFSSSIYVHPWQQTTETTSMPKKSLK